MEITNWKFKEIIDKIEIIGDNYKNKFEREKRTELGLPEKINDIYSYDRTTIEWMKMPVCYRFFLDGYDEEYIKQAFMNSELSKYNKIIVVYGWDPVVKIPTSAFIEDWENFVISMRWSGVIYSEDYKLIMEFSQNNYYLNSNFEILKNSLVRNSNTPNIG